MYRSKEQTQFASRVQAHLDTGGAPLLLEGAAGLGKTRAYLAPLLATGQPVAVCVPTRALATQLLESGDMAAVRSSQSVEATWFISRGRRSWFRFFRMCSSIGVFDSVGCGSIQCLARLLTFRPTRTHNSRLPLRGACCVPDSANVKFHLEF